MNKGEGRGRGVGRGEISGGTGLGDGGEWRSKKTEVEKFEY